MSKVLTPKGGPEVLDLQLRGSYFEKGNIFSKGLGVSPGLSLRTGIDLIEVSKVRRIFGNRDALQRAVFTQEELRYSLQRRCPFIHLAERFAVKEALFKALGTGLSGEADWRDVELQKEISGKPALRLSGKTVRVAQDKGVVGYSLSVSHTNDYAVALVLLVIHGST